MGHIFLTSFKSSIYHEYIGALSQADICVCVCTSYAYICRLCDIKYLICFKSSIYYEYIGELI